MNGRALALASCSGLLLAASFPPVNLHLLAWIALVPLLVALDGQPAGRAFLLGGLSGVVCSGATVSWLAGSVHAYGGLPLLQSALINLILCAYLALYPALFGAALAQAMQHRPSMAVLAAPLLWTSLELARTYLFTGFPWLLLGYSQFAALPVIQIADITGVYGVSFLIVFVNAAITEALGEKRPVPLVSAALVLVLVLGYGWMRLQSPDPSGGIVVSVIQGNIDQNRKWDPAYQRETFTTYLRLTRDALKSRPGLVLWPETSLPFYFRGSEPASQRMTAELTAFVKTNRVPLLVGSPTRDRARPDVFFNSAILLNEDGAVAASYRKLHLVPFGEYAPVKKIPFIGDSLVQAGGEFEPGGDYTLMSVSGSREETAFSTVICYEIIFPDLVRRFVKNGARIITTMTNDAWFGRTAAPYQHFSMAVFRAVENRVPVARAANTGISGFIDSKGRVLSSSTLFTEGHFTRTLAPGRTRTVYTAFGDLFSYLCVLTSLALFLNPRMARPSA